MASDELDALLETVGPGVAGAAGAMSAKDISRLLAARLGGAKKAKEPGSASNPASTPEGAPTKPPPPGPPSSAGSVPTKPPPPGPTSGPPSGPPSSAGSVPTKPPPPGPPSSVGSMPTKPPPPSSVGGGSTPPAPEPFPAAAAAEPSGGVLPRPGSSGDLLDPDFAPTPIHPSPQSAARDRDSLPTAVMPLPSAPPPQRVQTLAPEEVFEDSVSVSGPPPPAPLGAVASGGPSALGGPSASGGPSAGRAPGIASAPPPSAPVSRPPASSEQPQSGPRPIAISNVPVAPVIVDEPSAGLTPMSRGSRFGLILAIVVSVITVVAITAFLLTRGSGTPTPGSAPAPTAPAEPVPSRGQEETGDVSSAASTEAAARAALWQFAEGVRGCARTVIGELPGTAPAIPPSFSQLKSSPYQSGPGDYRSPVYSCTSFRQSEPQAFQVQWQVFKGGTDGMAIAWLDGNGDGAADRALGLRVTLVKKGEIAVGESIEVLDPIPSVAR
ncbi:hypothetical protein [Chondromyces apiculatus]|nr:hypothetical protein [Chondromyces apiculatus]